MQIFHINKLECGFFLFMVLVCSIYIKHIEKYPDNNLFLIISYNYEQENRKKCSANWKILEQDVVGSAFGH